MENKHEPVKAILELLPYTLPKLKPENKKKDDFWEIAEF